MSWIKNYEIAFVCASFVIIGTIHSLRAKKKAKLFAEN